MSSSPLVSVIIPTHGRRPLLEVTLASVRAQTLADWEAVVVDDHSPDDTLAWLTAAAAEDARIRPVVRSGKVGGANIARNQGVAASRGKYVVFLDSDDLLEPDCLKLRTDLLEAEPELDFTVHAMRCFREVPNDTDYAWNTLTDEDDFDRYLLMDGPWQTTGATWRRTALDRVGPWDPAVLSLQDLDFHIRALSVGLRYRKINAWDSHYRLPRKSGSITSANRSIAHVRSHVLIGRRLLGLSDQVLDASPHRRERLAAFCFLIAERCAAQGDVKNAMSLWNLARRRRVVHGRQYLEGAAILLSSKSTALAVRLKFFLQSRWPANWRLEFRKTFLNSPLPMRATRLAVS